MGLRCFLASAQNGPFEPDPAHTGVGKGFVARCALPDRRPKAGSHSPKFEIQQMTKTTYTLAISAALISHASLGNTLPDSELPIYELKEIIVRGDIWETELQKMTASVSVLESESIQRSGSQHFGDLINSIPNLTWSATSSRPRYIQLRGIGENSQFEGETPDASVRFLVDDLDFTGIGTIGNLFDTQQVEVLRGPQAGAFGVNAAGGVIQIVSNEPTPYWTGKAEATIGDDSLLSGGIAFGGPLIAENPEKLTFRFSAYQLQQDGFRENHAPNINRDDTNERDEFNTRLKLRWIANDDWQWDATFFYADADNGYDEWSLDNTRFDVFSDEPGRDEQESFATSLRGTWTGLDKVEVTTISSFTDTDSLNSFDSDWTTTADPRTYNGFMQIDREREVFSQEVRFDSTDQSEAIEWIDRWTLGLYLNLLEENSDIDYRDIWSSPAFPVLADSTYKSQSYAAYGQIGHDFTSTTRFIFGLRTEYYKIETKSNGLSYGTALPEGDESESETLFGGKITLEHDLTDKHMAFASISRGYKAGGSNIISFLDLTAGNPLTYDNETLWNYEIGLRSNWLNNKVHSQVTAFYLNRKNAQLRDSDGAGGFFNYFTSNQGKAEHFGAELEATWLIAENWSATAALGILDAELDRTGEELASAPSYTYSAKLSYAPESGFFANFEVSGSDEYYESNNPDNRDQRTRSEFVIYNAAMGYSYENWTLTIWGRNIFDKEYEKRVFFFANNAPNFDDPRRFENPADPQQFGATLSYSW